MSATLMSLKNVSETKDRCYGFAAEDDAEAELAQMPDLALLISFCGAAAGRAVGRAGMLDAAGLGAVCAGAAGVLETSGRSLNDGAFEDDAAP